MDSGQQESGVRDASLHTALQATRMKIDGGDSTQWSPAGQVRKIKTPRALLPRERPLVTETHSSATPPKEYAGNGTGATTSTSSKAKITNVACQECQRKKCKVRCRVSCNKRGHHGHGLHIYVVLSMSMVTSVLLVWLLRIPSSSAHNAIN